jgi:hypothetical protein
LAAYSAALAHEYSHANRACGVCALCNTTSAFRSLALLRKELVMVTVKVKDGTPQGSASLCVTCRYVHIVRGFSASEQQVRCQGVWPSQLMHFPVSQCSSYDDSRLPSKRDMEKIAWILLTKKAGRSIGFVTSKQFQEIEGEDAEIIPATALHAEQPPQKE